MFPLDKMIYQLLGAIVTKKKGFKKEKLSEFTGVTICLITSDSLVMRHIRVRDEIETSFTPPVVYFLHTTTAPHILESNIYS